MDNQTTTPDITYDNGISYLSTCDGYGEAYLINTILKGDRIELVYRRDLKTSLSLVNNYMQPFPIIYKHVYRAVGDQLLFEKMVYGKYVPPREGTYEFDDE